MSSGISGPIKKWLSRVSNPSDWYNFVNDGEIKDDAKPAFEEELKIKDIEDEERDEKGVLTAGILRFTNGDVFEGDFFKGDINNREGIHKSEEMSICGKWIGNKMEGFVKIKTFEGTELSAFQKGVRHGMCR